MVYKYNCSFYSLLLSISYFPSLTREIEDSVKLIHWVVIKKLSKVNSFFWKKIIIAFATQELKT
jgi:hypothetical protein